MKVLIVDDASFMRMKLRSVLEGKGFTIIGEAENGKIGVKKYIDLKPDIITLDITMPEMDGIAATEREKRIDPNAEVIMVSAMGQEAYYRSSPGGCPQFHR